MSTEHPHPLDPPYRRPSYHDGMLLEAEDFLHEQEYHRKRLANALLRLHGFGTVAGLKVDWDKAKDEVFVMPGVAIDARGRVLELDRRLCLEVEKWFAHATKNAPLPQPHGGAANEAIMADVYLRFVAREEGLRPAFPEAAADALDAVVPFRLVDGVKVTMHAVPAPGSADGPDFSHATAVPDSRAALVKAVLEGYTTSPVGDARARILEGMPAAELAEAVFLARVSIPVAADLARDKARDVTAKNDARPLIPSVAFAFARSTLGQL
jgi:hypothetical protein